MGKKSCWIVTFLLVVWGCLVCGASQWTMIKGDLARTGVVDEAITRPLALLWQYSTAPFANNLSAPLVADGIVYFPVANQVYAIRAATGELFWEKPYELGNDVSGPASLAEGRLFVNCRDGFLYALNARTGALEWRIPNGASNYVAPFVLNGKLYSGTGQPGIYAVSLEDGSVQPENSIPTSGQIISLPAFADGALFFTCNDGRIYSVDPVRRTANWQTNGNSTALFSTPVVWQDLVILGNGSGNALMALSKRRGDVRWQVRLDGAVYASPTITPEGKVYIGTARGQFYALDATRRGQLLWQQDLRAEVRAAATVTNNGVVFAGTTRGMLYALEGDSGRVQWKYRLPDDGSRTRAIRVPLTIADGHGYLLADDGSLYCFSGDAFDAEPPMVTEASLVVQARDRRLYSYPLPEIKEVNRGDAEPMTVPGLPPIKAIRTLSDIGSGLDDSSIVVQMDRNPLSFEYDSDKASLTVTIYAPTGRAAQQTLKPEGRKIVTISAKDWRGNLMTDNRIFYVDAKSPPPDPPAGARQTMPGGTPGFPGFPGRPGDS